MNKIIMLFLIISTAQTQAQIFKQDNVFYTANTVINNDKTNINYKCFTGYPNNPYTNKTENWLALGYKNGTIKLSSSMLKMCKDYIAFNTPKNGG